jgi:hypothetical protein
MATVMDRRIVAGHQGRTRRRVRRIEGMVKRTIVVPITDNDGQPLTAEIARIQAELLSLIGGFSVVGSAGVWRSSDSAVYRDRSVTFTVVTDETTDAELVAQLPEWADRLRQVVLYTDRAIVEVWLVVDGSEA